MALVGGFHVATGSAVALSSLVQTGSFRQIDFAGNEDNAAAFYIGPAGVLANGTNAFVAIPPGRSWGHRADQGGQTEFDFANLYVIGTALDKLHIAMVK